MKYCKNHGWDYWAKKQQAEEARKKFATIAIKISIVLVVVAAFVVLV